MNAISELGKLAQLLNTEQEEDLQQYESLLRNTPISKRKKEGLTWFPVKITDTGYGVGSYPYLVVERNPGDRVPHKFSVGTPVSLFSSDGSSSDSAAFVSATVAFVDEASMKLNVMKDELPDGLFEGDVGVNILFDTYTYKVQMKALNEVINAEKGRLFELRGILLAERSAGFQEKHPVILPDLNDSQNEALNHVLSAEDVAVIHGPPGTGKTTTLVHCVEQLIKSEKQVLVCAASNAATDNIALGLVEKGMKVLRIGNVVKVNEDLLKCTLDERVRTLPDYKQVGELKKQAVALRKVASQYKRQFGKEERDQRRAVYREAREIISQAREVEDYLTSRVLDEAQVIACTLIGSTNRILRDKAFKTLVIDEAGQALEPSCWVAIQKAGKVVLAGDPLQLPPTVKSHEAEKGGLSKTLLEKRIERSDTHVLLRTQYRMNNPIMAFSNKWFYEGQLEAHDSVAERHIGDDYLPVEFIDTAGCGFEEKQGEASRSRFNPEEARILEEHLEALTQAQGHSIGIISPYREQVNRMAEQFRGKEDITVQTIDAFQGQERDIIYISLVRSNSEGQIGFLKDYRRMNVAMTRARQKLVIIGDSATIGQDKFYSAFLEFVEEQGSYRSGWEFMGY